MDTESLVPNQSTKDESTERRVAPTVVYIQFLVLSVILLGSAAVGAFLSNQSTPYVPFPGDLEVIDSPSNSMDAWSVGKKIHPPHPKKLHHGEVLYKVVEDPSEGRYYERDFVIPCGYGLLVFNIGPADTKLPFEFDVYDDGYVYSDNGGLCILYPSYKAHQNGEEPFWNAEDPTAFRVPLGDKMTKISTRINDHPHTKEMSKEIKVRGGDYLVMTKGDFYTPHYYQQLKAMVNSWKSHDNIDELIEKAFEELDH